MPELEQEKQPEAQNNEEDEAIGSEEFEGLVEETLEPDTPFPSAIADGPYGEVRSDVLATQLPEKQFESENNLKDDKKVDQVEAAAEQNEFRQQYVQNKEAFYAQKAQKRMGTDDSVRSFSNEHLIEELFTQEEYDLLKSQWTDIELLNINLMSLVAAFGSKEDFDFDAIKSSFLEGLSSDRQIYD